LKRLLILAFLLLASAAHAQQQPATVILVRHAEKAAAPADNPPLTAEGSLRAEALVRVLRNAGVTAIYSTPYARTRETAAPLAAALDLQITETPIYNRKVASYADSVAARVRREGGVILVVGHSNTMGAVIKALGGPDIGDVADPEYDNLFFLTTQEGQPSRLVRARYGPRSEAVAR
jgi:broad specificity phosphatase PhoE